MLSDLDRRILARACKFCLHEKGEHVLIKNDKAQCKVCGEWTKVKWDENGFYFPNPSFTTPDDWEMVRVKVVVPHLDDYAGMSSMSLWEWLLNSPQDCCWDIAEWIKSRPDLFPWVVDFIAEIAEKKMPTGSAQIASGKGMPWVKKEVDHE